MEFDGKRILVTGGTGSLGKVLTSRILSGELGKPNNVTIFSRDEAKQHEMRIAYQHRRVATDEVIYHNFEDLLSFRIGDVRDIHSVVSALRGADIVFNAAALKQVPTCEYFPYEAVKTNIEGAENIVRAIRECNLPIDTVIGISTDKACKPVNVMGMSKAIQERIFISANIACPATRFVCVRYGNVLASRGSVIPLFLDQVRQGGPLTLTDPDMTRFLLSLNQAVDVIFAAVKDGKPGETYIPRVPSASVVNIAKALIGDRKIETKVMGVRPGEKTHEILISEEECHRVCEHGASYYVIGPILPEIGSSGNSPSVLSREYSSEIDILTQDETRKFLHDHKLLPEDQGVEIGELLR